MKQSSLAMTGYFDKGKKDATRAVSGGDGPSDTVVAAVWVD